jgi:Lrp/AsnC family transcriptional regulator for asnA, asnC and gidA
MAFVRRETSVTEGLDHSALLIDRINMGIIRHLWDGRVPFSVIAKDLGVTENTIRARVRKLTESGVLQIIGLVDADVIPGHSTAFFGLRTRLADAPRVGEEVSRVRGVVGAGCVTGRFDVMGLALFSEEFRLYHFLAEELPKVQGIISAETFPVFKGFNFNVRYVL